MATGSDEISREDISLIADFAITTMLRNPETLGNAQRLLRSGVADKVGLEELHKFSDEFFGGKYPADKMWEALLSGAEKRVILNEASGCGKEYMPRNWAKANLMGMGFSLLTSPKKSRFVTSSSPVVCFFDACGESSRERVSLLWLPLSPGVVALFGNKRLPPVERCEQDEVNAINAIMYQSAKSGGGSLYASSERVLLELKDYLQVRS